MNATWIGREGNIERFEIEFTGPEFDDALIEAYKSNKDQFQIDGFRKGKAPRKIIEQHYGVQVFDEEAVEGLLQKEYPKALIALGIEPIDRPEAEIPSLTHGEGFKVAFSVPTPPEVEVKDYEGVKVKEIEHPVTDGDVDSRLEQTQSRNARLVTTDKEAENGDSVNIDYAGFLGDVQFEGGTDQGHTLLLGSAAFIEGFEEQLIGRKAGDEADVNVTFPEDYHSEELAGKDVVFKVKVNEVKVEDKPEINDEFAQDISEFDTLAELKADIKAKMVETAELRAEMEMKDAILEQIYAANEIDVPEVMVEDQLENMLKEFEREIKDQGFKLEQYFQMTGQSPKDLREQIKGDAYKRVKMRLLVAGIARQQEFKVSDEEVDAELAKMAESYSMEKENMRDVLGEFQIKLLTDDIKNKKAVDYIYENAIVEQAEAEQAEAEQPAGV
ncbi:MAG: trigger factor [Clostridiales Family XIII bacterium]|nr:trigger factor [Clostridiales Family XIII bacterium]